MSIDAISGFADDDREEDDPTQSESILAEPAFLDRTNRKSFIKRRKEAKAKAEADAKEFRGVAALIESWYRKRHAVSENDKVEVHHLFDRQYRVGTRQNVTNYIKNSIFITYFNHENIQVGYAASLPQTSEIFHVG